MGRIAGAVALLVLSLFMLLGFFRSGAALGTPTTIIALLVTVGLPAAGAVALLAGRARARSRLTGRREQLRRQTIDAEVLRLAEQHGGKLTVVEVVGALAVSSEAAQATLEDFHSRELAEIEITDSGVIVYVFRDVQRLAEKTHSRGILDA